MTGGWWSEALPTRAQAALVEAWLPTSALIADLSWGQVDTRVLHVRAEQGEFIVKAAGLGNHHIGREITAHERATAPLVRRSAAAPLVAADRDANVLVTRYLEGRLVQGSGAEFAPDVHRQAGRLLRVFHAEAQHDEAGYAQRQTERVLAMLEQPHRIEAAIVRRARAVLRSSAPAHVPLVPTHGDWQPRNWLVDATGSVRIIDFGRFDLRPAATDLARLAVQQWRDEPALEGAFLEGYGADPRTEPDWSLTLLREAISTAVWSHRVGDERFERQGLRMLDEALARF